MKQHPVPQHIASYQFRLVGQMTLRQFLELAAGLLAAWGIYSLGISSIIKIPLAFLSAASGAAIAFLPINERPLDVWVRNFLKSVYSPTQFFWKKSNPPPEALQIKSLHTYRPPAKAAKIDNQKILEYLETIPGSQAVDKIEEKHNLRLNTIQGLLGLTQVSTATHTDEIMPILTDNAKIGVRKLGPKKDTAIPTAGAINQPVSVLKDSWEGPPIIEAAPALTPPILVESRFQTKLSPTVAAQFSTTMPIPNVPETPNVIVGMVLNDMEKIIPNALIEINDELGETVRALKTNKLGQFFCASPLKNGIYSLIIEHLDWQFAIMKLKMEGKIVLPLKVKAIKKIVQ